jgi:ABC-type amino acid transport substrate-binding protein
MLKVFTLLCIVSFSVSSDTLKVAVYDFPPCVIIKNGVKPTGFDIEVFEEIAKRSKLDVKFEIGESFPSIIEGVEKRTYDAAIAGITITGEREAKFDFTHPYLNSGLSICVNKDSDVNMVNVLLKYFNQMKMPIYLFAAFLLFSAILIWVLERGKLFSKGLLKGVSDGIYWAITTITTVGYGDKTPQTPIGKLVTMIVMLVGIGFIFPYIVASMNTALQSEKVESAIFSVEDLEDKKVSTEKETTAETFLKSINCQAIAETRIDDSYKQLILGKIDAVVFDMPTLKYFVKNSGKKKCKIVGDMFDRQYYGFALQQNSPYRETLNESLVDFMRTDEYWDLHEKWFGD